jgi:hypothetical protein
MGVGGSIGIPSINGGNKFKNPVSVIKEGASSISPIKLDFVKFPNILRHD